MSILDTKVNPHRFLITAGLALATLSLITGVLLSDPITNWLIRARGPRPIAQCNAEVDRIEAALTHVRRECLRSEIAP